MGKIANVLLLKSTIIIFSTAVLSFAGILENLDKELTELVEKAEPYLVTVEVKADNLDEMFVGSGVLVDKGGYILTTTSVVGEGSEAKAIFKNGESFNAEIIGEDFQTGLALLKIDSTGRDIPRIGDSGTLKEGSWVIVIGNSYEMPSAVKLGVYSGLTGDGFLQLSVQSSPGSSGSAVLNCRGELVGLIVAQAAETVSLILPSDDNTHLSHTSGINPAASTAARSILGLEVPSSSTSLAVPASKLRQTIDQIKKYGEARHGYLGIRQKAIEAQRLKELDIENGIEIVDVVKDSPAEKAGIQIGDVLLSFNGKKIINPGQLYGLVRTHQPDDIVKLEFLRRQSKIKVDVVLGEAADEGYFGFNRLPRPHMGEVRDNIARFQDSLADKIQTSKNNLSDNKQLNEYIDRLEGKIVALEAELKELSGKFNKMYKELENK